MRSMLPKIGVYAGSGTSHSWLWFVDLFETAGLYNLVFLDEQGVQQGDLKGLDVLVMSGGDTFAVAESLGGKGASEIQAFVEQGGTYIGSCAGAYLPMKSSKEPLNLFNFVDVKITNLSKNLPAQKVKTCKFCTSYGCDYIFHPVREAMLLKNTQQMGEGSGLEFDAPLYGGPGMIPDDPSWTLAVYENFSEKTLFLTDKAIAGETLLGHAAVVRVPFYAGCFYLLGPHLEHPGYEKANQFIIDAVLQENENRDQKRDEDPSFNPDQEASFSNPSQISPVRECDAWVEIVTGKKAKQRLLPVKRELSNSRITAGGLEFLPIQWLIGKKVYEPQKIRVYLESMWKRLILLEKQKVLVVRPGLHDRIVRTAVRMTRDLRKLRKQVDENTNSLDTATQIFDQLHILAVLFFELYFETMFNHKRVDPGCRVQDNEQAKCAV